MDELKMRKRKRALEFRRRAEELRRQEELRLAAASEAGNASSSESRSKENDRAKNRAAGKGDKKENNVTWDDTVRKGEDGDGTAVPPSAPAKKPGGSSTYPENVGNPLLKASPSSDVSMSQSPSKLLAAPSAAAAKPVVRRRKRTGLMAESSSSSSEEDDEALARRIAERNRAVAAKNKQGAAAASKAPEKQKKGGSAKKKARALLDSDSDDDDNWLSSAKQLAKKRSSEKADFDSPVHSSSDDDDKQIKKNGAKAAAAAATENDRKDSSLLNDNNKDAQPNNSDGWKKAAANKPKSKRRGRSFMDDDSSDSDVDLQEIARKMQKRQALREKELAAAAKSNDDGDKARKTAKKRNTESDSDAGSDGDKATKSARSSKSKKRDSSSSSDDDDDDDDDDDEMKPKTRTTKSSNSRKRGSLSSSDGSSDDGNRKPKKPAKMLKAKKRDPLSSSDGDPSSDDYDDEEEPKKPAARNPLTEFRQREASALRNVQPSTPASDKQCETLWSDSEDDAPTPVSSTKKKKASPNGDSAWDPESIEEMLEKNRRKKTRVELKSRKREQTQSRAIVSSYGHVREHEIEEMKRQLMPDFSNPKFGPFALEPLKLGSPDDDNECKHQVPASIARYLKPYQMEGITFMYDKAIVPQRGVILGDDMGLGKTVQAIALIAALLGKHGTGEDLLDLKRREEKVQERLGQVNRAKEKALAEGRIHLDHGEDNLNTDDLDLPEWSPILIMAPNAVVSHWKNDLVTWGHFSYSIYQGVGRDAALESVNNCLAEVMLCPHSMIARTEDARKLVESKPWKLVVVDELHKFKNEVTYASVHLRLLRDAHHCVVVGLTGTVMQNRHKELWNAMDLVAKDFFGDWKTFESDYARPISLSRSSEADPVAVEIGEEKSAELSRKMDEIYLRRTKEEVLFDDLPNKDERIVFCEPSKLQKELYQHIIAQPDFILLAHANAPCDCGVNQKFFLEFQHLRTMEDRINYQRHNRSKIVKRSRCCHPIPLIVPEDGGPSEIDPDAILWNEKHPDGLQCRKCPYCICFTLLHILYKLSSHISLLQCQASPEQFGEGSAERQKAEMLLERAKFFIPEHIAAQLPGGYFQENGMMDDHFALSGKMAALHKLLNTIQRKQGRTLIFSPSTQMLDLIQNYLNANGISFRRMDGQTSNPRRDEIADDFRNDSSVAVFLLSTSAMGCGLTLVEANYVIIFDVDWNPSNDQQAMDRAFRIGQTRDVKVFRLVSRGTIEELKYLRQVYKTQLQKETIVNVEDIDRSKAKRLFRGVEGDKSRKGELFGIENLLKFKDGHFINYASKVSESKQYGVGVHGTEDLLKQVQDMDEEEFDTIGDDGNVFEDLARCCIEKPKAKASGSDVDADEENEFDEKEEVNMGGMSQTMLEICDKAECHEDDEDIEEDAPEDEVLSPVDEERALAIQALVEAQIPTVAKVMAQSKDGAASNALDSATLSSKEDGKADSPAVKKVAASNARDAATLSFKDDDKADSPALNATLDAATSSSKNHDKANSPAVKAEIKKEILGAEELSTPEKAQDGANEKDLFASCPSGPSSETQAINAMETQSPIDRSKIAKAASTAADSIPRAKPVRRNIGIVGKTTNKIRNGEAGRTTFSAFDLPMPKHKNKK